jgi:lipopolysaccharide/colanic/teichoic acid biosynthesis glycosyltransferase
MIRLVMRSTMEKIAPLNPTVPRGDPLGHMDSCVRLHAHVTPRFSYYAKRTIDTLLLAPISLIAIPLVVLCALAIVLLSPGNPFYGQHREGRHGRRIRVWKLRTMYEDAEDLLVRHLAESPEAHAEWLSTYKLRHDPRILPIIGTLLRRSSLDELPQLWNIARGDMSFVGPRPLPDYHLAAFDEDFRVLRRTVLPGLTGMWQTGGRADGTMDALEALDRRYIMYWSVWLDLSIIARTPGTVFKGKGAY